MAGEWQNALLGEVCEINPDKRDSSWPYALIEYIDITSVGSGMLNEAAGLIPVKEAPSRAQRLVRAGDTIVSTVRPNRRSFLYLREPTPNTVVSTGFVVLRAKKGLEPRFLYYLITDEAFTTFLVAHADGSAYPAVNASVFGDAQVSIPPLPEQRAIVHILGTLDDKIELNQRMNETLEAMAMALFKSWFVDFDPVRAKVEGRDPGLPKPLADLFPDSFEDSALGEIPKGWRVSPVGEYMVNFDSKRVPVSGGERAKRQGRYPYHGAAGVMDHVDDYLFDGIYLLVGEDGSVVQSNGMAVTQYVWGKLWVNNHAHVLQGRGAVSTEQLYLYFHFETVVPYVTGAVQPKLSQGRMNTMPFVFAGAGVCLAFSEMVQPLFTKLRANMDMSKTLADLRDTLLPKLITGELRVKDAERIIGRHV